MGGINLIINIMIFTKSTRIRRYVRVVKETDSKSVGLCLRRFESCCRRFLFHSIFLRFHFPKGQKRHYTTHLALILRPHSITPVCVGSFCSPHPWLPLCNSTPYFLNILCCPSYPPPPPASLPQPPVRAIFQYGVAARGPNVDLSSRAEF